MPVEVLRASLPHTNDRQRKLLLDFDKWSVPGFQQISTLDGNQTPDLFVVEVLFTMFITATGLLFLQALGRRSLQKSVRGLHVEQWMSHRQLLEELKRQIRESEGYNWLATGGDVCGEELVTLCGRIRIPAQKIA
ncbi:hypothetical protein POM88_027779 [Heracleum sosnowskyi]|uniref:Uncharacterized protein n=1 Tax=Heracleum sosnowskyi TaxID=360622 RepID=A0AAD8I903_9APIA|nr:hypothetical protein POM88_027779 [Heracleum sosnowskyi]